MEQYIPKSAVLAEIEKRIVEYKDMKIDSSYYEGMVASLEFFRDEFINTFEVKEVDLEKEIDRVWDNTSDYFSEEGWKEFENIAKHFFELGLKAQKGEPVSVDLEAEIKKAFLNNECSVTDAISLSAFTRIARHFANWQKQHSKCPCDCPAFKDGIKVGRKEMKQQMDEYLKDMSNEIDLIGD